MLMINKYEFSERLANLIKQNGLTVRAVADRTGISNSTMKNYLHGSIPPKDKLEKIAEVLQVGTDELLYG